MHGRDETRPYGSAGAGGDETHNQCDIKKFQRMNWPFLRRAAQPARLPAPHAFWHCTDVVIPSPSKAGHH